MKTGVYTLFIRFNIIKMQNSYKSVIVVSNNLYNLISNWKNDTNDRFLVLFEMKKKTKVIRFDMFIRYRNFLNLLLYQIFIHWKMASNSSPLQKFTSFLVRTCRIVLLNSYKNLISCIVVNCHNNNDNEIEIMILLK